MRPPGPDGRPVKRLRHLAGKAIHSFDLIGQGDRIAVGLSGGKDSLLLFRFLAELKRRAPVTFELGVLHLGPAEEGGPLWQWLQVWEPDFVHLEPAPYVPELAQWRPGRPSPCFKCARARRSRLFELCRLHGAGSLALGHHLDDAMETVLMNMFFSGSLETMAARQDLFGGRLALIRPFILTPEALIVSLTKQWRLPVERSACPADGRTRRQEMKNLIAEMTRRHPKVHGNLGAVAAKGAAGPRPVLETDLKKGGPDA